MITIPVAFPWTLFTPPVFRYLPTRYADEFFESGLLRLSSFRRFHQHTDEQRFDANEGNAILVHRNSEGTGQTAYVVASGGRNAYVLCGSMRDHSELMKRFEADSYIRINDTNAFATAVARHVPGLNAGAEGPCLYQEERSVLRDLGPLDFSGFGPGNTSTPSGPVIEITNPSPEQKAQIEKLFREPFGLYPLFLKHKTFAHQSEYRLIWLTSADAEGFLDIRAPEAIQFCSRPTIITE